MPSNNTETENALEWDTVRQLLKEFHIKQSIINTILETTKAMPQAQVYKDEKN